MVRGPARASALWLKGPESHQRRPLSPGRWKVQDVLRGHWPLSCRWGLEQKFPSLVGPLGDHSSRPCAPEPRLLQLRATSNPRVKRTGGPRLCLAHTCRWLWLAFAHLLPWPWDLCLLIALPWLVSPTALPRGSGSFSPVALAPLTSRLSISTSRLLSRWDNPADGSGAGTDAPVHLAIYH